MCLSFKNQFSFLMLFMAAFTLLSLNQLSAQDRLASDRPGFSISSTTMPKGFFQGQFGTGFENIEYKNQNGGTQFLLRDLNNETNLRFGVLDWLELDATYSSIYALDATNLIDGGRDELNNYNIQLYSLGTRFQLMKNKNVGNATSNIASSLSFGIPFRLGSSESPIVGIRFSGDISTPKNSFLMNVYSIFSIEEFDQAGLSLNYSRSLTEAFWVFAESRLFVPYFFEYGLQFNIGANYYISPDFMIDIYGGYGSIDFYENAFSQSPFFQISAGLSWNINLKK